MKIFLLRLRVMWRRFRQGERSPDQHDAQYATEIEALMRRANPFATWQERANWTIDIAEWIRHEPTVSLLEEGAWRRVKQQRVVFMLDWLDANRDVRRVVQTTLQKTLREAAGPELFSATGLPNEPAFFNELSEHVIKYLLPKPPAEADLSVLFTAMFPHPEDAEWLLELDAQTVERIWKLTADDGISHMYHQQIDEALIYLVTAVLADGISKAFRYRLDPKMPLQATPFMVLRRELEKYLYLSPTDEGALRSVRMLIAVCQAQTDRIYAHLDEHGVSVSLVYRVERMRAHLSRMTRLIDLRAAVAASQEFDVSQILRDEAELELHAGLADQPEFAAQGDIVKPKRKIAAMSGEWSVDKTKLGTGQIQALLVDFILAHHHRSSIRGLLRRSFSLLARKMVERNADHGEHYIARDKAGYRAMLLAACRGGVVTAFTVLGKSLLSAAGFARFFEGLFASLNYAVSFLLISSVGGVLATKQPAVTAPALAAKMSQLDTVEGLRTLLAEVALLLRSQAAAVFGNLIAVVPTMLLISMVILFTTHAPMMGAAEAHKNMDSLSIVGPTPLFAALTGILLWLSSLASGFADNWFALRRLREALTHQRRLVHVLGPLRAQRWAAWLERHIAQIVGNISLGLLLGMSPVIVQFFGLHLDVRHVTLATGSLTAAASSLGWSVLLLPHFWLAVAGIASIGLLNVGVSFGCALVLALRAREVPVRIRRLVFRAVLRRFSASPRSFLFPEAASTTVTTPQGDEIVEGETDAEEATIVDQDSADVIAQVATSDTSSTVQFVDDKRHG
ncbi:site-specific recombinase [Glaciimonas sp. PCH181]|uniref:site-specific recombinase n=1 Tax=Glaciimonas sp. PCH181 TaxID=2133943 RepID=UPI000D35AA16|nr:site-specific recombinase [Glaciimonas sp. PCH181]PUA19272.1 preprotein translocase subunit TatB [Glaciimonas sp. PCH181]